MRQEHSAAEIPEWARRERQADLAWIRNYLFMFQPVATAGFADDGRGAIVVDTTWHSDGGNTFEYFPQSVFEEWGDEDIQRMIREYDPLHELVMVMLKANDHTSTYRVMAQPRRA